MRRRKQGRSVTIADDLNSPALDTIIHATRNLIQLEKIDIDTEERTFLVAKIQQVMELFLEEMNNP